MGKWLKCFHLLYYTSLMSSSIFTKLNLKHGGANAPDGSIIGIPANGEHV